MGARLTRLTPAARDRRRLLRVIWSVVVAGALLGSAIGPRAIAAAAPPDEVSILGGEPASFDPAAAGDVGSAAVIAQVFESLTAVDSSLILRPALARSWDILDGGRRIVFHLRTEAKFSDGSQVTGNDVVASWLRIIDPAHPSPLAALMADVDGALPYLRGETHDASSVGLRADGAQVEVRLVRPGADFPAIVSSPTFAVVPPSVASGTATPAPGRFVGSGAYILSDRTSTELTFTANEHYWAGPPAVRTVHLRTDVGGRSLVAAFEDGDVDYTPIQDYDAAWVAYDSVLGPQLRSVPTLALTYLGFDTRRPPFDDVRVRRAVAAAVDWRRLAELASGGGTVPATGMVPPGIPGRSDRDFLPAYDPASARAALSQAGYPDGSGFPAVTMVTGGTAYEAAIVAQLRDVLGITVASETMSFDQYFTRLAEDPPQIWALGWIADYPGPNDFLGVLLGTGSSNDYGGWSSPEFDASIADALATSDQAAARAAYDRAQDVVRRDVPVIPLDYGTTWALSRDGLLGAGQNGMGILRWAGLAWSR